MLTKESNKRNDHRERRRRTFGVHQSNELVCPHEPTHCTTRAPPRHELPYGSTQLIPATPSYAVGHFFGLSVEPHLLIPAHTFITSTVDV